MLKNICGIKLQGGNFLEETDLKFFNPENGSRVSLVYGKNGAGKSTISRAFNKAKGSEELSINTGNLIDNNDKITITDQEAKQIFIFNEDYIDANIRFNEEGLNTIVVLGEQKQIEDKINEARENKDKAQKKFDNQKKMCEDYNNENNIISPKYHMKNINLALRGDESWAGRDGRIKVSKQASSVRKDTYKKFIKLNPKKTKEELLVEFSVKFDEYEAAKSGLKKIDTVVKTDYKFLFDEKEFIELLAKKLEEPILSDREKFILDLATKQGYLQGQGHLQQVKEYFSDENNNICPCCMQSISKEHKEYVLASIQKILSKASKEHQAELDKYKSDEIKIEFEPYKDLDESLVKECQKCLEEFNKEINKINRNILAKQENVYTPIKIEELNISLKFSTLIDSLKHLEDARNDFNKSVTDVSLIKTKLEDINNNIAYYDIKDNYDNYKKQLELKDKEDIKLKNYAKDLESLKDIINKLEAEKKNIRIAMKSINDGLRYILFSDSRLSIEYRDNKYYLLSRGKPVTPQKISVGERNAIALCYFFTDIMQNKEENEIYNEEYMLIIDDPVSSFDIENRVGILSYLKYKLQRFLCGNKDTKVIIMTHDIQTLYDIQKLIKEINDVCKEKVDSSQKKLFSIKELSNQNLLEFKFNKRNEYTTLMENIFDYAQEENPKYELVIGNSMRRVLEAFSTFIYKKGIDKVSTSSKIMEKIPEKHKSYFENLMYRLVLNGGSHAEENIKALRSMDFFDYISSDEKKRTAKDVLCFMYFLNDVHVLEHLSTKRDAKQTIEGWLSNIEIK